MLDVRDGVVMWPENKGNIQTPETQKRVSSGKKLEAIGAMGLLLHG